MTDQQRIDAAWARWADDHPGLRLMTMPVRALVREAHQAGFLAAELIYRREPA